MTGVAAAKAAPLSQRTVARAPAIRASCSGEPESDQAGAKPNSLSAWKGILLPPSTIDDTGSTSDDHSRAQVGKAAARCVQATLSIGDDGGQPSHHPLPANGPTPTSPPRPVGCAELVVSGRSNSAVAVGPSQCAAPPPPPLSPPLPGNSAAEATNNHWTATACPDPPLSLSLTLSLAPRLSLSPAVLR